VIDTRPTVGSRQEDWSELTATDISIAAAVADDSIEGAPEPPEGMPQISPEFLPIHVRNATLVTPLNIKYSVNNVQQTYCNNVTRQLCIDHANSLGEGSPDASLSFMQSSQSKESFSRTTAFTASVAFECSWMLTNLRSSCIGT
jgi:hypothetical protein